MRSIVLCLNLWLLARPASAIELIADADTGYGGLLNVRHTVRGYEEAGVQAIQMEDQEMPKKCGHTPGKRVIPLADMLRKIDARLFANMVPAGGKSPMLSSEKLKSYGFDIAIYPGALFSAACASMKAVCVYLREHGSLIGADIPMFDIHETHRLSGFPEIWAFEKKYAEL